MKNRIIKGGLFLVLLSFLAVSADAQRTSRRRQQQATSGNAGAEQQQQQEQPRNTQTPVNYNPYGNIPIRVDTSNTATEEGSGKSLRPDGAFGFRNDSVLNQRTPLPYEHLRWDDALFAEKVWRELDLREKMNQSFRYVGQEDNGDQMFINILLNAVNRGEVPAFADDRFTTPMQMSDVQQLTVGAADTSEVRDINDPNKIKEYVVTRSSFDAKSVLKLRIKEEWVFDREASRMFVRILGIAPVKTVLNPNGTERGSSTMFWVYYPDLRPTLARYEVYNPKNMGMGRMTWEELFESRMFSSYITKSTLDNPNNRNIRQMIKDPILALLEGENIKERIFNYEQDLWSY